MITQVIILMTDKKGHLVDFTKDELADYQTPSIGALQILKNKVLPFYPHNFISRMAYVGCWKQNGLNYVFQCYTDITNENLQIPEVVNDIISIYERQVAENIKMADQPLQEEITLDDLIDIKEFNKGKDIEKLQKEYGFYENEGNLYSCTVNFPESMDFAGINIFKKGQPRGNHSHLRKIEYIYVLRGKLKTELYMPDNPQKRKEMIFEEGMLVRFLPGHHHILTATTPVAVVLEVCPQKFDIKDIFR